MKRKAFTLVELLVVIAILGILGSMSVVGYNGFKKRANYRSDTSLVTQWNKLLDGKDVLASTDKNEKLHNVNEVKTFFIESETLNDDFTPKSTGYHFYWSELNNNVYLVDDSTSFVIDYPETTALVTLDNSYRLDLEYAPINCNIPGVNINRTALVINKDNVITLTGTVPTTLKVNGTVYTVVDNKITLKPTTVDTLNLEVDPTVYVSTISFKDVTSSVNVTYNQTQQLTPVFVPENPATTTVTWTSSDETVATVDSNGLVTTLKVGSTTITATSTDLFNAYGTCTVNVVPAVIQKPTNTATYTYTGSEQTFALTTNPNYTISNDKRTNAGSQKVKVVLNDKVNYVWNDNTTTDLEFDFNIAKATYDMSAAKWSNTTSYTYDGTAKSVEVSNLPTGVSVKNYTNNTQTNVGNYTASATFNYDETNYNAPTINTLSWNIAKANATITVDQTAIVKTYGETVTVPTATTNFGTVSCNKQATDLVNAGSYTITYTVAGTDNYNGDTKTVSVTINKATPTVTAPTAKSSLVYTGSAQALINAGSTKGGTLQYKVGTGSYSASIPQGTDAGNYTVYYKVVGNSNYNDVAEASINVSIAKATQSIVAPTATDDNIGSTTVTLTAVASGKGATTYAYNSTNTAPTTGWQSSNAFSDLTANTTYYFFAKYAGNDNYKSVTSTGTEIKTVQSWKSLTANIGGNNVYYLPVLGGSNPQPTKFAYSTDGETFTEITKPEDGYTMADVATYANAGTLYYSGGAVFTVRSVNNMIWNSVFADNSAGSYPYLAKTGNDYLQNGILALIDAENESVEGLGYTTQYSFDYKDNLNGVKIIDIYNAYNSENIPTGFGGSEPNFWSNVVQNNGTYRVEFDKDEFDNNSGTNAVLITRTFN